MRINTQLFERIIKDLPNYIFVKDLDLIYKLCNQNFVEAIGGDPIGKSDFELPWDKSSAGLYQEEDRYILSTGKSILNKEVPMILLNEEKCLAVSKAPLYDDNEQIVGILGVYVDITEKKKAEKIIIQAKIAAEAANKAKTEFIMNMSHDIRTPLSGILGLSSIQANEGASEEDRKLGKWVHGAGEQLLELLNSVIEVTAAEYPLGRIKKEKIDLVKLAEELETLMQPTIQSKKLIFQLKFDPYLPIIISDKIKLKTILLNLLSNAIKFTKKGNINFEINLLAITSEHAKIEIRITDTGIGIAKDKLNKIFERFYRAHPSYKAEYAGYGIGLFLVKQALELLSGEIKVSSVEGKGSCFTLEFNFPLAEEVRKQASSVISQKSPLPIEADTKKNSVLVIEDNTLVLFAIKNVLNNLGYEVTTVTEGKAALQVLQSQSFDWVLLDIGLPDLEGTEVVRIYRQWELENKKPHLPIFVLTAHEDEKIKEKCQEIDIDYILKKPFTENDILMIKKYIK